MALHVIIAGASGSGKSVIGAALAKRTGLQHIEMSDLVRKAMAGDALATPEITNADYVEHVLWPRRGFAAVAKEIPVKLRRRGAIITGPRRWEEIAEIISWGGVSFLFHLEVPLTERARRASIRDPALTAESFLERNAQEERWGLLGRAGLAGFIGVPNNGSIDIAVSRVVHEIGLDVRAPS